jgi:hypothetical protein
MWSSEINDTESAALCAAWRQNGITSAHDLRALLTAEARRRRWWLDARARWQRVTGRKVA